MGLFRRNTIVNSGLNALSEKYINDNFMSLFSKVSGGNINYTDMDGDVQLKLTKQWIPFQGEGNLDSVYPLYTRFYIPPNVKKISSAKVSIITTKYRMDSGIANSMAISVNASLDISAGGGGGAVMSYGGDTSPVFTWGSVSSSRGYPAPTEFANGNESVWITPGLAAGYFKGTDMDTLVSQGVTILGKEPDGEFAFIDNCMDMANFQHTHQIPPHQHVLPSHTHTGTARFELPAHTHPLNEGIKVSSVEPENVRLIINGTQIGIAMHGDGSIQNDIDFLNHVNIGAWNNIEVVSDNVARVSLYGVIELIQEYSKDVK